MGDTTAFPAFPGFAPPSANFTPAPNDFFDRVLGHYPLRVVTVVGILIRETVGWTDAVTGEKRIEVELPLSAFLRPELSENSARQGLREAIAAGFVVQTAAPTNRDGGRYALRWADPELQRAAIERQRRAVGDRRAFTDGDANGTRGGAENGGPNSAPPKIGPQDFGGPNSAPPYIKKRSPEKKEEVYKTNNQTFNVQTAIDIQNPEYPTPENVPSAPPEKAPVSPALMAAVRLAVAVTEDPGSLARFIQLRQICEAQGATDAWNEALAATEKAANRGRLRGTPGAYFNGTLSSLLQKRGVYVPIGSADEREDIRAEILASLGAAPDLLASGGPFAGQKA